MEAGHSLSSDATRQQALTSVPGIDKGDAPHQRATAATPPRGSPIMAPWSIYPFSPTDCAGLICDFLFFDTTVSADALVESLERVQDS